MKKNFKIEKGIFIVYNEKVYDLHNNYDFKGFHIDEVEDSLTLKWDLTEGDWIKPSEEQSIIVMCREIRYFSISTEDTASLINLHEIGYVFPKEDIQDWLLGEDNYAENCHIVFRFEGDQYIRLDAGTIKLHLKDSKKL